LPALPFSGSLRSQCSFWALLTQTLAGAASPIYPSYVHNFTYSDFFWEKDG
jgi:hypothetical protein